MSGERAAEFFPEKEVSFSYHSVWTNEKFNCPSFLIW